MDVSITIQTQVPAGVSLDYRGGTLPFGYLLEDGSVISRVDYARLFEAIGTTYGAGDGSTTFKLPDSRGRANIGSGTGSGLTARTLAETGGAETHALTEAELASHNHGVNDPGHIHVIYGEADGVRKDFIDGLAQMFTGINSSSGSSTTGITIQNKGSGQGHNNMQPFLVATKMIKY